ncbi:MAG: Uma2 family endonuclease [Chloroflexi bacterium]|nr:Uma2 family endonuclease [Chloroflexota bacterium]MCC6895128.1 Uma2 family endonuclease [Anaerolineae bacterium]
MAIQQRLYTVDEFEAFIAQSDHADRLFELIDGEIAEKMPTEEHSLIIGNVYMPLRLFVDPRGLGRVAFEVRRKIIGDDHNARLPDVEFTSKERLLPVVKKGAVPQMPDLAVEVKSPVDSFVEMREKANYYLKNGSRIVWLIFPDRQQIEVHTNDAAVRTLGIDDELDGGDVLPGFKLALRDIFKV